MVGKYVDLTESYKSLSEALIHAGIHTRSKVNIHYVDSEVIEARGRRVAAQHGRDPRAGRLRQARRRGQDQGRSASRAKTDIPYLGICLGMQLAVIECARHMAGLANANSTEFDPTRHRIRSWR